MLKINIEKRFTLFCFFKNLVYFYPITLVNTKTTIPPQGRCLALDIYPDASKISITIHYSPPLWEIVVKYISYEASSIFHLTPRCQFFLRRVLATTNASTYHYLPKRANKGVSPTVPFYEYYYKMAMM